MDCSKKLSNKSERLQNQALRIIFCKNRRTCSQVLRDQVKILILFNCRRLFRFITAFKIVNDINCPKQLQDKLIKRSSIRSRSLRDDSLLNVPNAKSGFGEKTFEFAAVRDWNSLPRDIRTMTNLSTFTININALWLNWLVELLFFKINNWYNVHRKYVRYFKDYVMIYLYMCVFTCPNDGQVKHM